MTKDEIRDYYQSINIRQFDEHFVEQVNKHDLFVIGGGNFFELCWDYSENGTIFNLSNKLLQKIKVPIFINGIGVDDNKGTSPKNIGNFREFLNTLFVHTEVFFTVRNDGSYDIFNNYFWEYIDRVIEIPDFGFFVSEVPLVNKHKILRKVKSVGFNIALDMPQIRYAELNYEKYLKEVAKQIDLLLSKTNFHIYLFIYLLIFKAIIRQF